MKNYLLFLLVLLPIQAFSQFQSYSTYDNVEGPVYQVENMDQYEIRMYNKWVSNGMNDTLAIGYINAARAQDNLIDAPATIINFELYNLKDSTSRENGLNQILVTLINTTPKTIKEITLKFSFHNYNGKCYDIRTGDEFCIMKFTNLCGRTNSEKYVDIFDTVLHTFHILDYEKATYFKPFYNKNVNSVTLENVLIKYTDGTISRKAAIWDDGYSHTDDLFEDGPLKPFNSYIKNF